jgi:hypothetical protein
MDTDGDFVVVWRSEQDGGAFYGVYGQRFDASGAPQGAEFLVNTYTAGTQDRGFSVSVATGQDGSGTGVYGQQYNADGSPDGAEFRVNASTVGSQEVPAVAMAADGDFVVAWAGLGPGISNYEVWAQRFGSKLPGDYNEDGGADAADYVAWRKLLGTTVGLPYAGADGDGDTSVDDPDDYDVWVTHYGEMLPGLAAAPAIGSTAESEGVALERQLGRVETFVDTRTQGSNEAVESTTARGDLLIARSRVPSRPAARAGLGTRVASGEDQRDEALFAWLAMRPDARNSSEDLPEINESKNDVDTASEDAAPDSIDEALALLASD